MTGAMQVKQEAKQEAKHEVKRELRLAACLGMAAEIYGQPKPSGEALKLWGLLMAGYPIEEVEAALRHHMAESPYMPKPADLIRQIDGTAEDRAAAAWAMLERAVMKCGHYQDVRFPDPAIHYAVDQMGGWRVVSLTFNDFKRRDFERHYRRGERVASFGDEPGKVQVSPYLLGECHASNAMRGYATALKVFGPDGARLDEAELALCGSRREASRREARALGPGRRVPEGSV